MATITHPFVKRRTHTFVVEDVRRYEGHDFLSALPTNCSYYSYSSVMYKIRSRENKSYFDY